MKPVQVCLEGQRYAEAYLALRRAKRAWHRLDAVLVDARQVGNQNPSLTKAEDVLAILDQQLDRLDKLLAG